MEELWVAPEEEQWQVAAREAALQTLQQIERRDPEVVGWRKWKMLLLG